MILSICRCFCWLYTNIKCVHLALVSTPHYIHVPTIDKVELQRKIWDGWQVQIGHYCLITVNQQNAYCDSAVQWSNWTKCKWLRGPAQFTNCQYKSLLSPCIHIVHTCKSTVVISFLAINSESAFKPKKLREKVCSNGTSLFPNLPK